MGALSKIWLGSLSGFCAWIFLLKLEKEARSDLTLVSCWWTKQTITSLQVGRVQNKLFFTNQSYKTRWNVLERWVLNQKRWSVADHWAVCWSEALSSVVFRRSFHPLNASFSPIFTRSIQIHCMSKKTSVFSGLKNSEINSRRTRTARNV